MVRYLAKCANRWRACQREIVRLQRTTTPSDVTNATTQHKTNETNSREQEREREKRKRRRTGGGGGSETCGAANSPDLRIAHIRTFVMSNNGTRASRCATCTYDKLGGGGGWLPLRTRFAPLFRNDNTKARKQNARASVRTAVA
jgi:hypothetical protein